MKIYRHGDVLIAPVTSIPVGAIRRSSLVLAYGEATGHAHRVECDGSVKLLEHRDALFLEVRELPARVVHEEHAPIDLPVGRYRIWRQRQYLPHNRSETMRD